jgi:hypothetical protein
MIIKVDESVWCKDSNSLPYRRQTEAKDQEIRKQVTKLLETGIINTIAKCT